MSNKNVRNELGDVFKDFASMLRTLTPVKPEEAMLIGYLEQAIAGASDNLKVLNGDIHIKDQTALQNSIYELIQNLRKMLIS